MNPPPMPLTGPDQTTDYTFHSPGPKTADRGRACVVVISGEGLGRRADIGEAPVLIGRGQDADLHIGHRSVSRRHCEIWRDGGICRLRDLGSTNPTLVNDAPAGEVVLNDGDHVTVGETILKFIDESSLEARYHEEIYQLATRDPLSGLLNRRHWIETVDREIARALRHRRPLALAIIDIDLFKPINDRYGHIEGDRVLRQVSETMVTRIRDDDIAGRIGGEEFALVMPETDLDTAVALVERLREAVADTPCRAGDQPLTVTISIGVARLSPQAPDRQRLMAAADAALYRAKLAGRNRVEAAPQDP